MLHHCDLCHIDLDRISVKRGGQTLLQDVSMHIHCGQLTVQDFIAASLAKRPVWTGIGRKTRERVRQVLADVDAAELADRPLGRCSGGELQRVLLALALQPAPDLLVLDEPVSGIDRNGLKMFLDTLVELRRKRHMAILLVSHDLRFVREYADHVVLLEKNVLTQGTPGEVFASPEFASVFGTGEEEGEA